MSIATDRYKDLDFSLSKSDTNDFIVLTTEETIKQSITNLLLTRIKFSSKYEKPELGSGIYNLLSDKPTRFVALQIRDQIELTLENYEQRIIIRDVSVTYNAIELAFEVALFYTIISISLNDTLELSLQLIT